jgi:hypothetical protein
MLCCLTNRPVLAQNHTERGAAVGGLTGAVVGAAIGENNGDAVPGAIIGGALGLITGAAIGDSVDQDIARTRAYERQRFYHARAVSVADVVNMSHNRLSDAVIINHIHQNGVQRRLEVSDVIALHQQGVSEAVISAMQRAPLVGYAPPAPVVRYEAPLVVERYHYVAPPPRYWPSHFHYRHGHHRHYHSRPGLSWSISVGR